MLVLSYYPVGPRDQIQVVRLGRKPLLPGSHLASPRKKSLYLESMVGGVRRALLRETVLLTWTTLNLHFSSLTFNQVTCLPWFSSYEWR